MKVSAETLENRQTRLTIEASPEEVESAMDKTYRRLSKRVVIPGFRKGKAPRSVMERFVGKEALLEESLEDLVAETYKKAIEEQGIDPIAPPQIELVERQPVKYKALVSLRPVVDLADYRFVRLDPEKAEVKAEDVDKVLDQMRQQQAPWEPIEGPVSLNNMVIMDVQATIGEKVIIDQKGIQYQALEGSQRPVAGFAEKLAGIAKGETKEFALAFPENYFDKEVTGKEANYKVTIHEVKQKVVSELNDDFAKSQGDGIENMEGLRKKVTDQLQMMAEDDAKRRYEEKVLNTIVGFAKVQYPDIILEQEVHHLMEDQARQAGQYGQQGLENYIKNSGKTHEEIEEVLKPAAIERLTRSLVLGKLAEAENITATHEEIDAEIEMLAKMAGERAEEMRKSLASQDTHDAIEVRLITKKTLERIAQIAMGQAKKESQEPAAEANPAEAEKSSEAGK